jgi:pSer/pThr/pTyr-binding forkhead associated (FHA) protein
MVPVAPMPALPRSGSEPSPFADDSDLTPPPALVGQDMTASVEARQLTFVIPTSGRRHTVEIKDEIHVGRADPASRYNPELDLTRDDGVQKGVSRRHAVIQRSSRGILLVDLNSTNGTSLNNFRIPPDLPYPLNNGDEVRFGQLLVHVFLS